jgi:hypothetical protein
MPLAWQKLFAIRLARCEAQIERFHARAFLRAGIMAQIVSLGTYNQEKI